MFCPECGAKVPDKAKFCTGCGALMTTKGFSTESGTEQQESSEFHAGHGPCVGDFGMMKDSTIYSETKIMGAPAVSGTQVINIGGGLLERVTRIGEHCPLCGILVKDDYFKCNGCGRNFICKNHMDPTALVCFQCSGAPQKNKGVVSAKVPENRHEVVEKAKEAIEQESFQVKRENAEKSAEFDLSSLRASKHKPKPARRFQKEHEVSASFWYEIDGFRGCEMPTFFQYCVLSLRDYGEINVSIRKDINVEIIIHDFERHWRLEDYSRRFEVSTDEWQIIFDGIRNANRF
jgi:hypothetical protein